MRKADEAVKVNDAVKKVLEVFEAEKLSEEEMKDTLRAVEVTLGIKSPMPPMPPHHPPMRPEDIPHGKMMA